MIPLDAISDGIAEDEQDIINKDFSEAGAVEWVERCSVSGADNLLQLQLSETEDDLLGTSALGFCIWNVEGLLKSNVDIKKEKHRIDLKLPSGVRNISVKLLQSNNVILSKGNEYAVAGVR